MDDKQSTGEPQPSQKVNLNASDNDGKSVGINGGVSPQEASASGNIDGSPSKVPNTPALSSSDTGSFKKGFRKFRILLWKNYLHRRRAWSSLILGLVFILLFALFTVVIVSTDSFLGISGTKQNSTGPKTFTQDEMIRNFLAQFRGKEMLFVSTDSRKALHILDGINRQIQPRAGINWTMIASEAEVQNEFNKMFSNQRRHFAGAIIFEKLDPKEVRYKIRLSSDKGVSQGNSLERTYVHSKTDILFPLFIPSGPNKAHEIAYYEAGILGLQILIDDNAVKVLHNLSTGFKQNVTLKSFSYPAHREVNKNLIFLKMVLIVNLVVVVFSESSEFLIKHLGGDKENGAQELMKLRGYPGWMQTLAWYLVPSLLVDMFTYILVLSILFFVKLGGNTFIGESDFSLWLFILILAEISNSAFVFFICSFIKSATIANGAYTLLTVLIWVGFSAIITYVPTSFAMLMGMSFLPHGCLVVALEWLIEFDGRGSTWSSLGESMANAPGMNLGILILMFLVDTLIFQSLACYLESIVPSEYGVRKPWYYPVKAIVDRFPRPKEQTLVDDVPAESESKAGGFEPYHGPGNSVVGVDVQNIVKTFGRHKFAVNGVSVKMYEGEIFVLLGHNGAGKTTLISMLTGMFTPTSGTAKVAGYDIRTDLEKVRSFQGLCPQKDMLFDDITVMEHLMIYGQINSQSSSSLEEEAKQLLNVLKLTDKETTITKELSGGQKRKLCLAMSLIGGAKVVILDEPTSGMDPEARRAVWDFLLKMREQRTILLTTHYMEEADALGDRIGIMVEGKLQCCGSPTFLKSFYGMGYTLKMALLPKADKNAIMSLVLQHITNASLKPINMPSEMFIALPTESATSTALLALFSALQGKKEELQIESLGLSLASMDEVFVKVGELAEKAAVPEAEDREQRTIPLKPKSSVRSKEPESAPNEEADHINAAEDVVPGSPSQTTEAPVKSKGLVLILMHSLAILTKRYICTKRKIGFFLFQLVFSSLMMLVVILAANEIIAPPKPAPSLYMTLDSYKNPTTFFSADQTRRASASQAIGSSAKYSASVEGALRKVAKSDIPSFWENHIVAGEITGNDYIAWFNTVPLHAAPLAINLASNIRGRDLANPINFHVSNHPLETQETLNMETASIMGKVDLAALSAVTMVGFTLVFLAFVVFPLEERLNKSKQLQLMTGINPLNYWAITLLWDLFQWMIVTTAIIAVIGIFQTYKIFSSYGALGIIFLIILISGYAIIPLAYIISKIPKTVPGGVTVFYLVLLIPSKCTHGVHGIRNTDSIHKPSHYLFYGFAVLVVGITSLISSKAARWMVIFSPIYCIGKSTSLVGIIAALNGRCNLLGKAETNIICSHLTSGNDIQRLKSCCDNCRSLPGVTCFSPIPYLTWKAGPEEPGLGQLLVWFLLLSIFCQTILMISEFRGFRFIRSLMIKDKESDFEDQVDDGDVIEEKQRVADMILKGSTSSDALVVDSLCKNYGSLTAVSKLTFGVHHGECFGLLGSNGAGKTTAFRMILGDELQSLGEVHEGRYNLKKDRRKLISNIGYCPQSDAFIPYLTGRENLQLIARLKGVPCARGNSEVEKWLEKVGLTESENVLCKKYSGGMKRRLSTAMALIGDPALLLLDEPTSGVDPVSRRQFWKVLESVKASGKSIIITTHSMDECEALCARLGIMVNGQLQCIGGVQHLKHKFAQGYSLTLRLKQGFGLDSQQQNFGWNSQQPLSFGQSYGVNLLQQQQSNLPRKLEGLNNEICQKFHPCMLKDYHETVLQYQIENTSIGWDVLYKTLEDLKNSHADIVEDYSVCETTLEEVFLSLSRKQYPPNDSKIPMWKRILTCQC